MTRSKTAAVLWGEADNLSDLQWVNDRLHGVETHYKEPPLVPRRYSQPKTGQVRRVVLESEVPQGRPVETSIQEV